MDPLTGLSVACNIMQVISFSAETLALFKQIQNGKPPDSDIGSYSKSLMKATTNLRTSLKPATANVPLVQVADELITVANSLDKELQRFAPQAKTSKIHLFRKTVAYQFKGKGEIEKLSRQLDRLQDLMQTELLRDLRYQFERHQLDTTDHFTSLDEDLRAFYVNILSGLTRVEDIVDRESGRISRLIAQEGQRTRDQTTQYAQATTDLIISIKHEYISDAAYQRFLDSFRFPRLNERRNTIPIAHTETFEWIYQEPTSSQDDKAFESKWDSFPAWLRNGKGIYWVSGKAGAGKSTLMKFLLEGQRTKRILCQEGPEAVVISAFIWSAGDSHQKSLPGVLSTLLHDVFSQDIDLCRRIMGSNRTYSETKRENTDWSLKELNDLFLSAVESSSRPICAFIDGLDEIDRADPTALRGLLSWLEHIGRCEKVKICASSRPELIFESRLQQYPHLRVQDLTAHDIRRYVSDTLDQLDCHFEIPSEKFKDLVKDIVQRAEGVFLWVHLVVEHLRIDMENFPTWPALVERVESLPSELDLMYQAMWKRQNGTFNASSHRAESAYYLNSIMGNGSGVSTELLLQLLLMSNSKIQRMILEGGQPPVSVALLVGECSRLSAKVVARCAGLITVRGPTGTHCSKQSEEEQVQSIEALPDKDWRCIFIHRSAKDFLQDTDMGRDILSHDNVSAWEHNLQQASALLCMGVLAGDHLLFDFAIRIMRTTRCGIKHPPLYSAFFELLVESCLRRSRWIEPALKSIFGDRSALIISLASLLVDNGFRGELRGCMESMLPDQQVRAANEILLRASKHDMSHYSKVTVDFMTQMLNYLEEQHLSQHASSASGEPLAWYLFWFIQRRLRVKGRGRGHIDESDQPQLDLFIEQLLRKCGDFGSFITARILSIPTESSRRRSENWTDVDINPLCFPAFPIPVPTLSTVNIYDYKLLQEEREDRWVLTLIESNILGLFFHRGSRVQEVLAKFTDIARRPTDDEALPRKLVMVLELIKNKDGHICDLFSKKVHKTEFAAEITDMLDKAACMGTSSVPNLAQFERDAFSKSTFSMFQFYDSCQEKKLDKHETLDFLVTEGYIRHEFRDHPDPLAVLVQEYYRLPKSRKGDLDWSFRPQYDTFRRSIEEAIKKEQASGNLHAIPPCNGGTRLSDDEIRWSVL